MWKLWNIFAGYLAYTGQWKRLFKIMGLIFALFLLLVVAITPCAVVEQERDEQRIQQLKREDDARQAEYQRQVDKIRREMEQGAAR